MLVFLVLAGNSFCCYLVYNTVVQWCQFSNGKWVLALHTYVLRVQYSCGVVLVFWFGREIVFDVTYVLIVQYICAVVSFFWLWQEIVLKMRTRVSTKKSYWVTLLRSNS